MDSVTSLCLKCPDLGLGIMKLVGLIVGGLVLLAGSFLTLVHPAGERLARLRPARRTVAWLACYARGIGFVPKVKIIFSFYGIATVLDEVYDAEMPPAYTNWVNAAFDWVNIDWVSPYCLRDTHVIATGSHLRCPCVGVHHTPVSMFARNLAQLKLPVLAAS